VEYLVDEAPRRTVRRAARALLTQPVDRLTDVALAWRREIAA
jgi:hypothetical protein